MMAAAKDPFEKAVWNGTQLAYKVTMNSIYGFCGAAKGFLPCLPIASSTTTIGRNMIDKTKSLVEENYPGSEVIYGDSVADDTPVLTKDPVSGRLSVRKIEDLGREWVPYPGFKPYARGMTGKERSAAAFQVWTDVGWANVKWVIRHETSKEMFRIRAAAGVVDVTEDHSLLTASDRKEIKPRESGGVSLLRSFPDISDRKEPIDRLRVLQKADGGALDAILNSSSEIRSRFVETLRRLYGHVMRFRNKTIAQGVYCILRSVGETVSLSVRADDVTISPDMGDGHDAGRVTMVRSLGDARRVVYDLETDVGRFHAGVGELIVKNTDSVFVRFCPGKEGPKAMEEAFRIGAAAAEMITATFKRPIALEFEKVMSPLLLVSKKRYAARLWTRPEAPDYIDMKGLQLVRRDSCMLVKEVGGAVLDLLMNRGNPADARRYVREQVSLLLEGKVEIEKLIVSKSMRKDYKNVKQPHLAVSAKMEAREKGSGYKSGDRVPYVFVDTGRSTDQQFDKAEDPRYVSEKGLKIDYMYYLEHQLQTPILSLFEPILDDAERQLFGDIKRLHRNKSRSQREITEFWNKRPKCLTE